MKNKITKRRLVIFASGNGTNAEAIHQYFNDVEEVELVALFSNNAEAKVLQRAEKWGIPSFVFDKTQLYKTDEIVESLRSLSPDLIVLAGFMWMIPKNILHAFPDKIINVHPALLPKYGGKGMYGNHVHKAILAHEEHESGITIHFVNENYDEGKIIAQFKTPVYPDDDLESLTSRIHSLEHKNYPEVIHQLLFERHG